MPDTITDPSALLPPPHVLRERLSRAMRDVDVLSGLLKLSERVARRDGRPVAPHHSADVLPTREEGTSRG